MDVIRFYPPTDNNPRYFGNRTYPYGFVTDVTPGVWRDYENALRWCIERFGEPGTGLFWIDFSQFTSFWFVHAEHASEFKLRWV